MPTTSNAGDSSNWHAAMHDLRSQRGATLAELSHNQRVLVLFLRHAGCVYCREALADISQRRDELRAAGVELAIVHMSAPMDATRLLDRYSLADVHHFSDPQGKLYESFGLERAKLRELFAVRGWRRGFAALLRHGFGRIQGDVYRMPGAFLLENSKIINAHRHQYVYDRPDYLDVCRV
jgi:peroxiredoxin